MTNHRILWSGYKIKPTEILFPSPDNIVKNKDISGPPIPLQPNVKDVNPTGSERNLSELGDKLRDPVDGAGKGLNKADKESPNAGNTNPD